MGIELDGVNELVLEVADLTAAERFYTEVLQMPVLERWDGDREAVWVGAGPTRIGLWLPQIGIARGRGGVHVHYAIKVTDAAYDALVEHVRGLGREIGEVRWSEGARSAYVTDPDGHVVELWTRDIRTDPGGSSIAATPGLFGMDGKPPM
ncbi:MAG: VOC family protein [Candidatus Dormiibacterota bacterium]